MFIALSSLFIYRSYDYVQHDARFCQSCHIMQKPFEKWSTSPHHLVSCHECHKQPLSASLHQVWFYFTQQPKEVVRHPELDHKVCSRCHLSQDPQWKLIGETAGHQVHFKKAGIDCLDCHMGGVHNFIKPTDRCIDCHTDKVEGPGKKMAFMHCTDCHHFLAKSEELRPDRKTCLECHQKIQVGKESFPEEAPMSTFDCSTCHKPHEKIRPDRELCMTCHSDLKGGHPLFSKELSCTACHAPHRWRIQ
ncbi:MAG: cytochrome c3 family protein [Deltaproteobacteria bacterium]|nr:cytochrome c3 family protein [Deltaproteobacteria bacterium]MBI2501005.1 cytochrome c3 family protein [Deltaproteobacteria bacterium]MBI4196743.1 cytochrome c3 family protein [Deltaproteobacteria bacterium]